MLNRNAKEGLVNKKCLSKYYELVCLLCNVYIRCTAVSITKCIRNIFFLKSIINQLFPIDMRYIWNKGLSNVYILLVNSHNKHQTSKFNCIYIYIYIQIHIAKVLTNLIWEILIEIGSFSDSWSFQHWEGYMATGKEDGKYVCLHIKKKILYLVYTILQYVYLSYYTMMPDSGWRRRQHSCEKTVQTQNVILVFLYSPK